MIMKDFGFYRGVNLGGWFSQCDYSEERLDRFITERDMDVIAGWGLDHVRIPMDYNVLETEDGELNEQGFDRIARAVKWSLTRGLRVVLDLHKTAGYSFDSGEKEEGFFKLSMRSKDCVNVAKLCAEFGGGGHERAAGAHFHEALSSCWPKVKEACIKALSEADS